MSRSCKTEEVEHWATITQRGRVGTESHGDLLLHVQPAANEFAGRPRAHTPSSCLHTRRSRTCVRETYLFVPPHDLPVRCENPLCRRQVVGSGPLPLPCRPRGLRCHAKGGRSYGIPAPRPSAQRAHPSRVGQERRLRVGGALGSPSWLVGGPPHSIPDDTRPSIIQLLPRSRSGISKSPCTRAAPRRVRCGRPVGNEQCAPPRQ